jgi:hypothetical protein
MVKVRPCWPLVRGWRHVTSLGGNQLIVVCVYARRRRVAAVASLPLRRRRRVAAVLVAASLIVVVATAVAAVATASWTPWLKSTPMLAAGARMGGSEINGGGCGCGCSMRRIAGTMMWNNAARPTIEGSPPLHFIFRAAPLGSRRGNPDEPPQRGCGWTCRGCASSRESGTISQASRSG